MSASVIGWLCFPVAASVGAADNKAGMCACSYVRGTGMCRMSCPIQMPLAMCSKVCRRITCGDGNRYSNSPKKVTAVHS